MLNQSVSTMHGRGINRKIHHIDGTTESRSITMSLRIKNPLGKLLANNATIIIFKKSVSTHKPIKKSETEEEVSLF